MKYFPYLFFSSSGSCFNTGRNKNEIQVENKKRLNVENKFTYRENAGNSGGT